MKGRVIIVGLGQIGTSIALALRRRRWAGKIIGIDRQGLPSGGQGAGRVNQLNLGPNDFVILAVPVRTILHYLSLLPKGPLIMDVGSTKRSIVSIARRRELRFVGAHPVAGTEKSGPGAGDPDLFKGRRCFLSFLPKTSAADRRFVQNLWKRLGALPQAIDADRHDRLFAKISHLPHATSFSFVRAVLPGLGRERIGKWVKGSFCDMTRVASSPVEIWTDIFLENRKELIPLLGRLRNELTKLRSLLTAGSSKPVKRWIAQAKRLKKTG